MGRACPPSTHPAPALPRLLDALAVGLSGADQNALGVLDVGAQALPRTPCILRRVQAELGLQAHKGVDAQCEQSAAGGGQRAWRCV